MRDPQVAIVYLSDRRVAYSSIAFHMIRGYLAEAGVPHTVYFLEEGTLTSEKPAPPPSKVPVWLVSLPYEVLYADLVRALEASGVPPLRGKRRGSPLIVAGGPAVTANPLPLFDIVDAFLIGELEPVFDDLLEAFQAGSPLARLQEVAGVRGVLAPALPRKVKRVYQADLDNSWYPVDQRVPRGVEPVWGRSYMLETTRGCARMCRFCMEGVIFRPKRDRSFARLRELLEEGVEASGAGKVSFYSLAFFDSPHAEKILAYAVERGLEVSVPSLRAETITRERARLIRIGGQRTITIAPETGSCRLGRAINKCIGVEGTLRAVEEALEGGIRNIKLYLIVGFPGEAKEDLRETLYLVGTVAKLVAKSGGTLRVSINPFIPKPATPLQWAPLPDRRRVAEASARIAKEARMHGGRASTYDPKWAMVQAVLSRGDEKLGRAIIAWAHRGARLGTFRGALREAGVEAGDYTGEWPLDYTPPWHNYIEHPYASLRSLRLEYEAYLRIAESR